MSLDPKSHGPARRTFADPAEIDEFVQTLARYEQGELTSDQWRAFRLVRGTYGQRQADDANMVRIKLPQGLADAAQLRALADCCDLYGRGFGHLTTRQNLQLHFVRLHDVEQVMRKVADAGVTTRAACGNSVRTVTACPYAGVAADEAFDVTPYAEALTRYFLRHPLSASLPRKFKIAFEGCPEDHAVTAINDLGLRAAIRAVEGKAERGFRVTVGGGTAIYCRSGAPLVEFLPAAELLELAEAVIRVFHRLGDREHKQRNRLKFLIRDLGWDRFVEEVERARAEVRAEGGAPLPADSLDAQAPPGDGRPPPPKVAEIAARVSGQQLRGPGIAPPVTPLLSPSEEQLERWLGTNVRPQRQAGYCIAVVTTVLGDLTSEQLRVLSELCLAYGDGTVRFSVQQNLVLRWVPSGELRELYRRLAAAGLGLADAHTAADVTSCPGAESCKLAVTQSRGLGKVLGEFLRARPDLVDALPGVDLKISGCPNGCGQHHIAGIGFQGSVRKVGQQVVPQYFVLLGGGVSGEAASFGRIAAKVPARRVTKALERLVELYRSDRREGEQPVPFFRRVELARVKAALAPLEELSPQSLSPEDLVDLGDSAAFTVETQAGECAS
jgi:sulfite reductase beta subunit-like hemoprotein